MAMWLRPAIVLGTPVAPGVRRHASQAKRDLLRSSSAHGSFDGLQSRGGSSTCVPRRIRATVPVSMAQKRASSAAATTPVAPPQPQVAPAQPKREAVGPTFQEAVQRLQSYWASVGCAVWLPHNTEVGAGTMNPATFLRVLGPEPWNVCYAEPSIRPDDSRYGDNPNRVQRHTQFQVILKPEPGNPQELFLKSLEAIGIDTKAHDIRFVEDNWESPVLGAWGLGWEVWLDGMEITQFTYFQQAGSLPLKPVAVEITYGLERILMSLQRVDHFKDIRYNDIVSYGECFMQNEQEMSKYNLDVADVSNQRARCGLTRPHPGTLDALCPPTTERFDLFDKEAKAMIAARLPLPAYDNLLKTSQAFNMLDARGAVGVTERAELFSRMRLLAREVSKLWLERREEQGFPLLTSAWSAGAAGADAPRAPQAANATSGTLPSAPETFLLEIGSEELPAQDVASSAEQLGKVLPPLLAKLRLTHGNVTIGSTPRRLTAVVEGLVPMQAERKEKVRGPPAKAARGADGVWTKAAEGFAKKSGVAVSELYVEADEKGTEYVWATVQEAGKPAAEVLAQELPGLITAITFPRTMRWDSDSSYSRPLRWLVALHGAASVNFTAAGVASGTTTRVLRKDKQPVREVTDVKSHLKTLEDAGIVVDMESRKKTIWAAAQELAKARGGQIPESASGDLLEEVANLVEVPCPIDGSFDADFLQLPKEVLVMVMRKHQRYFPVEDSATGKLLPFFVTVANGEVDPAVVRRGNEAVLRARYEDARFFYRQDTAQKLESFRPQLSGTVFEKRLGSLLQKSDRVEKLVGPLAAMIGLNSEDSEDAIEAARLARADLATSLVMEFTALAGVMGRHYAEREGLDAPVCKAIFESVLPRYSGDILPESPAGIAVASADRVDSLVGLFAVGGAPSATTDPFGLRRAAYGLVECLVERGVRLDLRKAVSTAAALQPVKVEAAAADEVVTFVTRRLEQLLVDRGTPVELVRSVLKERGYDPALAAQSVKELAAEAAAPGGRYARVVATYARPTRLVRGKAIPEVDVVEALFAQKEETDLFDAVEEVEERMEKEQGVAAFFEASEMLEKPMEAFFEKVFVMAEDEKVRNNRLALMARVARLPDGILDLAELPGF